MIEIFLFNLYSMLSKLSLDIIHSNNLERQANSLTHLQKPQDQVFLKKF